MVFINNYNEFLAQTRLRQGRDFDELSISSGVAVPHLKAIEKANTHPFYSRNYYQRCVMKYASVLGVDEEIVIEQPMQTELALEPEAPPLERAAPGRMSLSEENDNPPPLPVELFASRGPLVPPQPIASAKPEDTDSSDKPQAEPASSAAAPKPAVSEPPSANVTANLTSLDEILPPKLDMTPPKAGFGFPVFLIAVGVALAAGVLAWQHLQREGSVVVAQKEAKPTPESKPADQAPPTPVVVDETQRLRAEVEQNLASWARYWGERNAAGHLGFFDSTFPEFQKYADNRRRRIAAAQSIEVNLADIAIENLDDDHVVARFLQSYRSDSFESEDSKELVWKKTASGMKIISERILK